MSKSPKENEEKMLKTLNAWKTLSPDKSFGGMTAAQFEAQISLAPRQMLVAIEDERMQQQAIREVEDTATMNNIQLIVNGVLADPSEGPNSALYETIGDIRKDDRKSGLTRKRLQPVPVLA